MKQTRLWLTTIVVLLYSLTANAHDFEVGGIYYNITSEEELTVAVTYRGNSYRDYSNEYTGAVTIPTTVTYNSKTYSVTSIGEYAFGGCSRLTSITLPESVTSIGSNAFNDCSGLTSITIPEGVTSIEYQTFYNCSSLTSITLPESVTSIGSYAFTGTAWYSNQPDGVIYAGKVLYDYKGTMPTNTSIEVRDGTVSIGNYAFSGCSSLTSITLPESVTSIGSSAFDNCTALKKVIIEDGNTTLSLGYNYYSSTVQGLFNDCPLEEVYLGRNLSYNSGNSYGYSPFYNKDVLTNVTIGDEVTAISQYAFYGCDNIHSLTISSGVLSIGSNAFNTPEKVIWLTNTPPTGYTNAKGSINYVANDLYTSLSNVKVYPYLSSMFEVEGVKYVPVSPAERTCDAIDCAYNSTAAEINISETASFKGIAMTVKEVMPYAFYGNKHIKEVNISHKGNIGDYAFYDCDSVQSVELSNEGNVGSQTFYDCDGIKSLDISNIGYVGDEAFRSCGALETAIVANGPKEIEPTTPEPRPITFADWTSTNHSSSSTSSETYTFTAAEGATLSFDWWVSSESGYDKLIVTLDGTTILEKSGSLSGTYNHAITQGEHTLVVKYTKDGGDSSGSDQASVSNIVVSAGNGGTTGLDGAVCNSVFYDCVSLKSVTLGDKVTSLGNDAFRGCTSLQEIVIPDSVKSVGTYCFYGCIGLENVEIGNKVTELEANAFSGCSSLPTITIPQAVTKIGDNVFVGCSKLTDVIIADRTTALALGSNGSSALFADCPLDSVYIGGKITYNTTSNKGYSPFYRNTSLRTIVITDREEQIYNNEFYGCTNLQDVTIGNGVKSIGDYAFSGCSSLEGFSFGSNMETIGAEAFSDCTSLTSITSHAAVPPTCGAQALDDINKWECVLGVPLGNADAYYAADQWKEFFFIDDVVEVDHYVLTYVVDGEVVHTEVLKHKDAVAMLAEPTKVGYEFSGWDKTLATMPAEDVIISGTFTRLPVDNLVILDTEENFLIDEEMECEMVTYIRHFANTEWQALYVPFEIPYDSLKNYFEVADLNNVHQYDRDNDGVTDETVIEAFKLTSGTLEANYPYLIRAKEAGEKSITVTDAALYATEENSIDCSSVRDKFTFTGTYSSLSSAELPQGAGYYTLINGEWQPVTEDVSLGAFRFYLKMDSRSGAPAAEARSIRMRIIGENGEDDATSIDNSEFIIQNSELIYDLQGRRVENPTKGVYIVNGVKRVF